MQHAPCTPATSGQQHALYDLLHLNAHLFEDAELKSEYRLVIVYNKRQADFALKDLAATIKDRTSVQTHRR